MATYEVLEPGGHARLVSDTKGYANRAGGVGTTQIADESVTSAKLADDVTDTLDNVESFTDPMNKNGLHGELAEGTVLTADDVYPMPPRDVDVFGVSTQASTTGKNLLDPDLTHYTTYTLPTDGTRKGILIPVTTGTYTYHNSMQLDMHYGWVDDASDVEGTYTFGADVTAHLNAGVQIAVDGTHPYILMSVWTGTPQANMDEREPMLEHGATFTGFEPYTGAKPAPNPDYPQPIQSVDDLTLNVCGKNLFDPSHILEASGWTVSDGVYTGALSNLYEKYGRNRALYPIGGLSEDAATYTLSLDYSAPDSSKIFYLTFYYADGTTSGYANGCGTSRSYSFTTASGKNLVGIGFGYSSDQAISISNIQLELGSTATTYAPYIGQSVEIPLSNNKGRSLPDGTRDTLTLSYVGPSEREGWAWYSRELVRGVGHIADMGELAWNAYTYSDTLFMYANIADMVTAQMGITTLLCSGYTAQVCKTIGELVAMPDLNCATRSTYKYIYVKDSNYTDASAFKAAVAGMTLDYPLATHTTTTLDPIELPILPNPLTAWADGGSAQPTLAMEYERDVNIVISNMMSVIADAATS